jgi:hypothetical protein
MMKHKKTKRKVDKLAGKNSLADKLRLIRIAQQARLDEIMNKKKVVKKKKTKKKKAK